MKVAAIYDIHANLPALEAVIRDVRNRGVDRIVVGGDVLPGPMPRETMAYLLDLDIPTEFIQGNGDREVLAHRRGIESTGVPEQFREAMRWNAEQLSPEHEAFLASWPKTLRVEIPDIGRALFCHATPRNDTEIFTRLTNDDRVLEAFSEADTAIAVCGHTHMQFDRTLGNVRILNAGSVGMPFGQPGAYWLLLGAGIELRHTPYDLAQAAERIRATSYPQAGDFAARNILNPPSEQEMLEAFARVELK